MRGTRHILFVGSHHPLRSNFLSFVTRTSFFRNSTLQTASQSGGAAMRLCFIPGRMFPILASFGSAFILILIVFDVFIDCTFWMVTVFVVVVEYIFPLALVCVLSAVMLLYRKTLYCLRYYCPRRIFSKFDLNC